MKKLLAIIMLICFMKGNTLSDIEYVTVNEIKIPIITEISSMLPIGFIKIIFNGAGSIWDNKIGISSFTATMLDRGSMRGEFEFAKDLESNAIDLNVSSGVENIGISIEFLKEKQEKAISLLGELINQPNLTKEALHQSKVITTGYLLSKENDFDYIANQNLYSILFKGTPLQNPSSGSIKDVEKITLDDVKEFIKSKFILDNIAILVGGDLDIDNVKEQLQGILGNLPKGKKVDDIKYNASMNVEQKVTIKPTKQAYIYFGSPFIFNDYKEELHKSQIMSFIMGASGFGSRILEEIRVKRGLAYSAYFYNSISNTSTHTIGYLQTKIENKDEAIEAVKEVINDFLLGNVTQQELNDAKSYILGSRVLSNETLNGRLSKKYANFYRKLPLDYEQTLIKKIENLTLDDLNQYIRSHNEVNSLSFSIVTTDE